MVDCLARMTYIWSYLYLILSAKDDINDCENKDVTRQ